MVTKVSLIVVVCVLVGADNTKGDLKKLQGDWVLVSAEHEGNKVSDEDLKSCRLVIEGEKYIFKEVGSDTLTGTLKLDSSKTPKTIDSKPSDGEALLGIYELKDKEFKVSLAASGKERPKDFTSGDYIHVWKRAKK
jgi:uncharacterized protein (TIGR03067 family)